MSYYSVFKILQRHSIINWCGEKIRSCGVNIVNNIKLHCLNTSPLLFKYKILLISHRVCSEIRITGHHCKLVVFARHSDDSSRPQADRSLMQLEYTITHVRGTVIKRVGKRYSTNVTPALPKYRGGIFIFLLRSSSPLLLLLYNHLLLLI